ncbi:imelysin family protein [Candidatus Binatia bacterium]|nr:imelysin family protein [Candidatus Binatia bacterium]
MEQHRFDPHASRTDVRPDLDGHPAAVNYGAAPPRGASARSGWAAGIAALVGAALMGLSCGGGIGGGQQGSLPTTQVGRSSRLLEDLAWTALLPQYQAMTASFGTLDDAIAAFCDAPAAAGLDATRAAWRSAMESWVAASMFQLGPIAEDNRALRIEFWPDANNNVPRAVEQMLVRDDTLSADTLARQSVAAQGLPALERLLFDPEADALVEFTSGDRAARRCTYARAIGGNLLGIARAVEAAWASDGGYATQLASAGRGSDVFATREAAIDEVVNGLFTALSASRDDRLAGPLGGDTAAEAKSFRAESVWSGNSFANLAASLRGAQAIYDGRAGFGFDDYLRASSRDALASQITETFASLQAEITALPVTLAEAVQDEDLRPRVVALLDHATTLAGLIETDLSSAMDVKIGFNSNDGD